MKDTICENTDVSRFILHLLSKAEYQSRSPFQMISNRGKQFLLPRVCLYWTYRTFGNREPDTTGTHPETTALLKGGIVGCVPLIFDERTEKVNVRNTHRASLQPLQCRLNLSIGWISCRDDSVLLDRFLAKAEHLVSVSEV